MNKKDARLRRAKRTRKKIIELQYARLSVHRTSRHMYAQVLSSNDGNVLAFASTLDKDIKGKIKATSNIEAAKLVGKLVAERARDAGIEKVAFDRSGFSYHGRVKALADAAREGGLQF